MVDLGDLPGGQVSSTAHAEELTCQYRNPLFQEYEYVSSRKRVRYACLLEPRDIRELKPEQILRGE